MPRAISELINCALSTALASAPCTVIEGRVPKGSQPDGNSIVLEGPAEIEVIDTGRHPGHTDKIIAFAKARNKPITAIINADSATRPRRAMCG